MKYEIFMLVSLMNFLGFCQENNTEPTTDKEIKTEEIFMVGDYNFLFNKSECIIEYKKNKVNNFTFVGNEEVFEKFEEKDNFEFKDFIYPPELYIRNLTLDESMEETIGRNNHMDSEIGLYFGAHGLVEAQIFIKNGWIKILGFGEVHGKKHPVKINFKIPTLE